uniref:Retrovirus-related Pol polyprotein from transposon TNT 1-94 n=1 Tax=Tanacetum cinerariifolium TaxID=118510 RepID=A0A6L2MRE9_TANCI|nr:retrovirus-related Pol polyprotein from transposon TNT 1-94 [Tanacetum cinerariifolium]
MRLVIVVGYEEKAAIEAKQEAIKSDFDILVNMDKRRRAQRNAKETNDMLSDTLYPTAQFLLLVISMGTCLAAHTLHDGDRSLEVLEELNKLKENSLAIHKEFEKTCKTRITPTGLTEGERGFEQTKECYLTEVILFFKTLKEHFEGIQKALTKEIKEMKAIFNDFKVEVDQNALNRKCDEIEQKNLLITNKTLIANFLSKEVFYIATSSELNVSRFSKMDDAHTIVQARCLGLETELSKLKDKIQKDDHDVIVKCFFNLEELVKYAVGTCPKDFNKQDKKQATTPLTRKKQVTFADQCETSDNNTHKHVEKQTTQKKYVPMIPFTGVNICTNASRSKPKSNTKKNRISSATSINRKTVEDHHRTNKSNLPNLNRVDSSINSKRTVINSNSDSVCQTCNVRTNVGYQWKPTGRIFTLGEQFPLTRFTQTKVVPAKQPENVVQIVLWYLDSGCSKHMTGDRSRLMNFVKKFIKTVRLKNDHFGAIMGYEDYVIGDNVIYRVYYVEGLGHNLFSVRQFCDSDLEVAFRKHSSYVQDTDGVELIKGSRVSNLYTTSVEDMMKSSPICLLSKAFKTKSWLWHCRLNHLNFGTINDLARKDLVRGLPRLKFKKDHLCFACKLGKSKKHTHSPKTENTNLEVLNTLHIDFYGPIRVQTIIGKKYILVIVDYYTRFTWVKFLRSKDETLKVVIKFLKQIQVSLNKTVRFICTDNGTKFVNHDLIRYYETAVATACYTQNRSLIHTCHNKTPYELVHNKKHDLTFLRVFGALGYPTNDSEYLGKLQPAADIGIFVGYAPIKKGYRMYNKRTRHIMETIHVQFDELSESMAHVQPSTEPAPSFIMSVHISSGLALQRHMTSIHINYEILFQPLFDEYFNPPPRDVSPVLAAVAAPRAVDLASSPSSTTIDQDVPSANEEIQEEVQTESEDVPQLCKSSSRHEISKPFKLSKIQHVSHSHKSVRKDDILESQPKDDHEVNSPQTETEIGSTSHGPSVTQKETRALNEAKKRRLDKGKLVFKIDECAERIIGQDNLRIITKGGCLVREYGMFDGTTWKKHPDFLKHILSQNAWLLTIRRRSRTDPTLLNDFEMAAEGNGDLPVPDLRTMEELCEPSLNGRGGPIAPIAIQATNFGLKNDMIQQV